MDFLTWLLSVVVGLILGTLILIPILLLDIKLTDKNKKRKI